MNKVLQGLLTVVVSAALSTLTMVILFGVALGAPLDVVAIIGLLLGAGYGLQAALLLVYDLSVASGWILLIVDLSWSLPNTAFGFVFGNLVYCFVGVPSRTKSEGQGWIVYMPRSASGFGTRVLQTLGTVNLGGTGQHERMHLLQARLFGPVYLVVFAVNYAVNFCLQVVWTCTVGLLLWRLGVRTTPYLQPPSDSAVGGFFGWIYYANLFEVWAYASGNP